MTLIEDFLSAIDAKWTPLGGEPITLQIIGSAALMLQSTYQRGTKDGDVLESKEVSPKVKEQLISLAGRKTELFNHFRMYIDVVNSSILFAPQNMVFHPVANLRFENFSITVLDIADVIVSKLKRFNDNDKNDIKAMVSKGLVEHKKLVTRVEAAIDWFSLDARAPEIPKCINNLNIVERDMLGVATSTFDLPDWI